MKLSDPQKYFNYFRMNQNLFHELLSKIGPQIKKCYYTKEPICPAERLAVTLRYLASGDSMTSISYAFRIGKSTVSQIIMDTCNSIWEILKHDYLLQPCEDAWRIIATDFEVMWQLPHCIGAIGGKHVYIQAPPNSGSEFYNYKNCFSIILLAVCDARYKFSIIDIGAKGRQSDGGVLRNSEFGRRLSNGQLQLPEPMPLEDGGNSIPYYIVGDEAFPLKENLMRPFPGKFLTQEKRIFNYRLCRGRRISENTFGIFVSRWRAFRKPLICSLKTAEAMIKATICLHNFLMAKNEANGSLYCTANYTDREDKSGNIISGLWRQDGDRNDMFHGHLGTNTYKKNAAEIRENLALYFMTEGAVPFQWDK